MGKSITKKSTQQDFFIRDSLKKENECWSSTLFHDVFIRNDMNKYFKEFDLTYDNKGYERFLTQLNNIVRSLGNVKISGEDNTVEKVIIPVMSALGWVETDPLNPTINKNYGLKLNIKNEHGEKGELDFYITEDFHDQIYIEEAKKKNGEAFLRAREKAIFNVEAKAWGELQAFKVGKEFKLVDKSLEQTRGSALTPPQQACKYMQMMGFEFTILTDGNTWQLLNQTETLENPKRVYEFDFGKIKGFINQLFDDEESSAVSWEFIEDQARYFYYMFSKNSLYSKGKTTPVGEMLKESSKYAKDIQEDLKIKFLDSMNIACNALGRGLKKDGYNLTDESTQNLIRGTGENLLFTLLFIKSLEARNILNTNIPDYENPYSLKYVINSIDPSISKIDPDAGDDYIEAKLKRDVFTKDHGFKREFSFEGFELYDRILNLIDIVEKGKFGFSIDEFTKSIFSQNEKKILKKYKISNRDMFHIFFNFGFAERKGKTLITEKYAQIPYDYFAPRELGSIYESFLDFQLAYAEKPTFFNTKKKQWQDIDGNINTFCKRNNISPEKVIPSKSLYFRPDNKDRLMSGSYYTPDPIVRKIVEKTMGKKCDKASSTEILNFTVCDPAMGSAHFLVDSLIYLTNRYREKLIDEQCLNESYSVSINKVLKKCIFGADLNPRAVKLAKFSLWLSTDSIGISLKPLDEQLTVCNSLTLKNMLKEGWKNTRDKFSFIVGNPPWGAKSFSPEDLKSDVFSGVDIKNINTFDLFTRLSLSLTSNDGSIGFLIPRNFIRKWQYSSLRQSVLPNITAVLDTGKFPGVIQEACAIILDRGRANSAIDFDDSLKNGKMGNWTIEKKLITEPYFLYNPYLDKDLESVSKRLQDGDRLDHYFHITRGISCSKAGLFSKCKCGRLTNPPKKKNKHGKFEKKCSACNSIITKSTPTINLIENKKKNKDYLPIITGPDIAPGSINLNKWILSGVDEINYKDTVFTDEEKIFVKRNSHKIVASIANKDYLATETVYILSPKSKIDFKKVVDFLNSNVTRFIFEYNFNMGGELTNSITNENLSSITIPRLILNSKNVSIEKALKLNKNECDKINNFLKNHQSEDIKDDDNQEAA
jgi:hypothetical protein